jgi:predicted acetyltransferase
MADASVRLLTDDELPGGARLVARQMLGSVTDDAANGWGELWKAYPTHGAFAGSDLVGVAQWMPTRLSLPGEPVDAAAVTAVGVLTSHRRQGHLTRLMHEQLRHITDADVPVAMLIAAEYPIYGRFGYGAAVDAAWLEIDSATARFTDAPSGSIEMVDPARLRPALQEVHDAAWAHTPGALLRDPPFWDYLAGVRGAPGATHDPALQRGALWHDDAGELCGAVAYKVQEQWTHGRPDGVADVRLLVGSTPVAQRELWRHLCTLDWVRTVKAGGRAVDDPLPLWLHDARAVGVTDRFDHVWLRILDLPATMHARRHPAGGTAVLEVHDHLERIAGRWQVELGPGDGAATTTTAAADVSLSAATLGAAFLGGRTLEQLARAGLVHEERPGGLVRASALLATPTAPFTPLDF